MSYRLDTIRCPYCRGDMLITEHMSSGSKECECAACGTLESWKYKEGKLVHKLQRPAAYIYLVLPNGRFERRYFGKHPYKWVKSQLKAYPYLSEVFTDESYGVVYDRKCNKLITVFGTQPTIYPDEYYEDDELLY